jgi:hypothetical protein
MHDDKAHLLLRDLSVTVLDLDLAHHALSTPVARRFVLGPPRFFH